MKTVTLTALFYFFATAISAQHFSLGFSSDNLSLSKSYSSFADIDSFSFGKQSRYSKNFQNYFSFYYTTKKNLEVELSLAFWKYGYSNWDRLEFIKDSFNDSRFELNNSDYGSNFRFKLGIYKRFNFKKHFFTIGFLAPFSAHMNLKSIYRDYRIYYIDSLAYLYIYKDYYPNIYTYGIFANGKYFHKLYKGLYAGISYNYGLNIISVKGTNTTNNHRYVSTYPGNQLLQYVNTSHSDFINNINKFYYYNLGLNIRYNF